MTSSPSLGMGISVEEDELLREMERRRGVDEWWWCWNQDAGEREWVALGGGRSGEFG